MKKLKYLFAVLFFCKCINKTPTYFTFEDCLVETFKHSHLDTCNILVIEKSFKTTDLLHIFLLFKINYIDVNGKGNNYYYGPGGFGRDGILHKIQNLNITLLDKEDEKNSIDITDRLYRDTILNKVRVRGKGLLNFNYELECSPMGLPKYNSLSSLVNAINANDINIHANRLLKTGVGFSFNLHDIPKGKYRMLLRIIFMDTNKSIEKNSEIEITE